MDAQSAGKQAGRRRLFNSNGMTDFEDADDCRTLKGKASDASMLSPIPAASLKYVSLVLLTLQTSAHILLMRYTRTRRGDMYLPTTAVILSEVFKLMACVAVIFWQKGRSIHGMMTDIHKNILQQPLECLKISVPAIVYTLQNNLLYVAVSNLEVATYQVTYQLKILTTATFSVVLLRKHLTKMQWFSLLLLFVGVTAVQLQPPDKTGNSRLGQEQNPMLGLVAVIVACFMSGFAGIYFEMILKGSKQTLWIRNVQLCFSGVIIGCITMWINDRDKVMENGFFFGYTWVVVLVVALQAFGGLMVALVVKYADNILKSFAASAAIVISCVASVYFFNFQLSLQFSIGTILVIVSIYLYSRYAPMSSSTSVSSKKVD